MTCKLAIIEREDGLRYGLISNGALRHLAPEGLAIFTLAEIRVLANIEPLNDEAARGLIAFKQQFPLADVVEARRLK